MSEDLQNAIGFMGSAALLCATAERNGFAERAINKGTAALRRDTVEKSRHAFAGRHPRHSQLAEAAPRAQNTLSNLGWSGKGLQTDAATEFKLPA
jgi:hypothetical protein